MEKLSVIIPVYNAGKWINQTLDSLVSQTYENIEIICVDDGSSDNSKQIINEYAERYRNIKLICQENAGVCAARNRGIEEATGAYIAFIDADDYADANMYKSMIEKMENENSDIVFCEFVRFWPNGKIQYTIENSFDMILANPQDIKYFLYSTESITKGNTLYTNDIHGSVCRSVFLARIIQKESIRFHGDLRFAEDQVFLLEYLQYCARLRYLSNPYIWYRGWTKAAGYRNYYSNHLSLLKYQTNIVNSNTFYSKRDKKRIIGYLDCSTYFMIVNEEFRFNPNAVNQLREYSHNKAFSRLLNVYSFIQKYKIRREPKRIVLFVLLKMHCWHLVQKLYPNKKY